MSRYVLVIVLFLNACGGVQVRDANVATVRAEISARSAAMLEAELSESPADVASFFAPDGVLMLPDNPAYEGREGIKADYFLAYNSKKRVTEYEASSSPIEIHVAASGELAYERGSNLLSYPRKDGSVVTVPGKYLIVWEWLDDNWYIQAMCVNIDGWHKDKQ